MHPAQDDRAGRNDFVHFSRSGPGYRFGSAGLDHRFGHQIGRQWMHGLHGAVRHPAREIKRNQCEGAGFGRSAQGRMRNLPAAERDEIHPVPDEHHGPDGSGDDGRPRQYLCFGKAAWRTKAPVRPQDENVHRLDEAGRTIQPVAVFRLAFSHDF